MPKDVPFPTVEHLKNAKTIIIKTGESKSPDDGKTWILVMMGCNHITGTTSKVIWYSSKDEKNIHFITQWYVPSAQASAGMPLVNTDENYAQGQWGSSLFVVNDTDSLKFTGGTNSSACIRVIEI